MDDRMVRTTIRIKRSQLEWMHKNMPQQISRVCRDAIQAEMHQATPVSFHNAWRESAQKCYPRPSGGYCGICWPAGTPDQSEWRAYISNEGFDHPHGLTWDDWVMVRHGKRQSQLQEWNGQPHSHEVTNEESGDAISHEGGVIRRFWRFLF